MTALDEKSRDWRQFIDSLSLLLSLIPWILTIITFWSLGSYSGILLSLLDKLDKLVWTHSTSRLITLSNNRPGKKAMLLLINIL